MSQSTDVFILDGARTAMAEYNGAFADVSAIELGVHAAREALRRSGVEPGEIDHAIFGNALQTSGDAIYGARHVALKAGVPEGGPRADRQPAVRLGVRVDHPGRPPDPAGRGEDGARGGDGEHVPGPARHPGRAQGLPPRPGPARGLAHGRAARLLLRPLHGADLRPRRREVRDHPRRAGRLRALLAAAGGGGLDRVPAVGGGGGGRGQGGPQDRARREGRPPSRPTRRSRDWRRFRRRSARTDP